MTYWLSNKAINTNRLTDWCSETKLAGLISARWDWSGSRLWIRTCQRDTRTSYLQLQSDSQAQLVVFIQTDRHRHESIAYRLSTVSHSVLSSVQRSRQTDRGADGETDRESVESVSWSLVVGVAFVDRSVEWAIAGHSTAAEMLQ